MRSVWIAVACGMVVGKVIAAEMEPEQAFPYTPPDARMRVKYVEVFSLTGSPKERLIKLAFDKTYAPSSLATLPWPFSFPTSAGGFLLAIGP